MPLVNFAVSGAGTGVAQTVAVKGADYVIETDAYEAFGGQDRHPSPLAYTLASLSSCNQVTSSIVAKELGITIDAVTFAVSADFDPTVMTTGRAPRTRRSRTCGSPRRSPPTRPPTSSTPCATRPPAAARSACCSPAPACRSPTTGRRSSPPDPDVIEPRRGGR